MTISWTIDCDAIANKYLNTVGNKSSTIQCDCQTWLRAPPLSTFSFEGVELTKALGISLNHTETFILHVNELLDLCTKTLFALHMLKQHWLSNGPSHDIFQATIIAKLTYVSQPWRSFVNAADCTRQGLSSPTLASVCDIQNDSRHLLRQLLLPTKNEHYNLCKRQHSLQLHAKTSSFSDNSSIIHKENALCEHWLWLLNTKRVAINFNIIYTYK